MECIDYFDKMLLTIDTILFALIALMMLIEKEKR